MGSTSLSDLDRSVGFRTDTATWHSGNCPTLLRRPSPLLYQRRLGFTRRVTGPSQRLQPTNCPPGKDCDTIFAVTFTCRREPSPWTSPNDFSYAQADGRSGDGKLRCGRADRGPGTRF